MTVVVVSLKTATELSHLLFALMCAEWALGMVWMSLENLAPPGSEAQTHQPIPLHYYILSPVLNGTSYIQ